jgi:hypothetical protein
VLSCDPMQARWRCGTMCGGATLRGDNVLGDMPELKRKKRRKSQILVSQWIAGAARQRSRRIRLAIRIEHSTAYAHIFVTWFVPGGESWVYIQTFTSLNLSLSATSSLRSPSTTSYKFDAPAAKPTVAAGCLYHQGSCLRRQT